jgi:hypothetical protein
MILSFEEIDASTLVFGDNSKFKSKFIDKKNKSGQVNPNTDKKQRDVSQDDVKKKKDKQQQKQKKERNGSTEDEMNTVIDHDSNNIETSAVSKDNRKKKQARIDTLATETSIKQSEGGHQQSNARPGGKGRELRDIPLEERQWGGIPMLSVLVSGLESLSFVSPTPIQASSLPITMQATADIVGIAETGSGKITDHITLLSYLIIDSSCVTCSGKTLAFSLPIVHEILSNWTVYQHCPTPMALVIAPTRELVLQIAAVINEIASTCAEYCKIEVVTIIGGMSEQKQKRLLSNTLKRPVHIIVATPGRLHEMIFQNDIELSIFHDMARLRYLVVDEVDRIMEEGHFNELHRIFSRIREHEQLCDQGKQPIIETINRQLGITVDNMNEDKEKDDNYIPEDLDDAYANPDELMTEENAAHEIEEDEYPPLPEMPMGAEQLGFGLMSEGGAMDDEIQNLISKLPAYIPQQRQTLLFSATANQKHRIEHHKGKRIKGIGEGAVRSLPRPIQE